MVMASIEYLSHFVSYGPNFQRLRQFDLACSGWGCGLSQNYFVLQIKSVDSQIRDGQSGTVTWR
jgi:hypothetical protein